MEHINHANKVKQEKVRVAMVQKVFPHYRRAIFRALATHPLLDFTLLHGAEEGPGDEKWNEAIREALDAIHLEAQSILPDTWIEWYGRGITRSEETWIQPGLWAGREIKSPLSCSLYMVPEEDSMRQTFKKTCELADSYNIKEVIP
jgi:hypothetical protein